MLSQFCLTFFLILFFLSFTTVACHKPPAPQAEKIFVSDEALQKRMTQIYQIMLNLHSAKQDTKKAAAELEATVKDIFANCQLEPTAEAVLHPILGDILTAAALQKQGKAKEGMDKLHEALASYKKHFSPAGW